MVVYIVEGWKENKLRDYWPCATTSIAYMAAATMGRRLLNGVGEVYMVDRRGVKIPLRSIPTLLRLGKSVGIVQDGNDNLIRITVHSIGEEQHDNTVIT